MRKLIKLPGVLSDIDGVIYRGSKSIHGSDIALRALLKSYQVEGRQVKLPFSLLTNGGGQLESVRADLVNEIVFGETNLNRKTCEDTYPLV